jgi:hypothetical protein
MTPQKPRPAVPALRQADAARNTSNVDVDQQQVGDLAGANSLPDVPLPKVPLPKVTLYNFRFPNVPVPELRSVGLVGEE